MSESCRSKWIAERSKLTDDELALTAYAHASDTQVPALNDFTTAEGELQRSALGVLVEDLTVEESAVSEKELAARGPIRVPCHCRACRCSACQPSCRTLRQVRHRAWRR